MSELSFLTVMPVDPSLAIQITEDNIDTLANHLNGGVYGFAFDTWKDYRDKRHLRWQSVHDDYTRDWADTGDWIIIDDEGNFRSLASIEGYYAEVADI